MSSPLRPRLRPLEMIHVEPEEEPLVALHDPEEFGEVVVLSCGAAILAMLMDGHRTLAEIQSAFQAQTGAEASLADVESVVRYLDEAYLLANERFAQHRQRKVEQYLADPVREAAHADGAYAGEPDTLRKQLAGFFDHDGVDEEIAENGAAEDSSLRAIISPHIDPNRGGRAYACAYQELARHSTAELFVIFGTAHDTMQNLFSASRKDFATPLGTVQTDRALLDRVAEHLEGSVAGRQIDLFADELAHRREHSIEFQAVFLQYLLGGRRNFRIVPILVGSMHEFIEEGTSPDDCPEVEAFIAAVHAAVSTHPGKVCLVSGADLAHVGQHFGDKQLLEQGQLDAVEEDDRALLKTVCRCDATALYAHVAGQSDRHRICGLAPIYTMLRMLGSREGKILRYDQAVEPDGTSAVSFASVAFYGD